jgi:hypothetical protein
MWKRLAQKVRSEKAEGRRKKEEGWLLPSVELNVRRG